MRIWIGDTLLTGSFCEKNDTELSVLILVFCVQRNRIFQTRKLYIEKKKYDMSAANGYSIGGGGAAA